MILVLGTLNISSLAKETENSGGEVLREIYEEEVAISEIVTPEMELESENNQRGLYLESVMKTRSQYSAYYGGCYLKKGELIVKLTDTSDDVVSYFRDVLGGTINYEKCSATIDELKAIKAHIENYIETKDAREDELVQSIVSIGTFVKQNKVQVCMKDCTEEKIALFKKLITDSEHVLFESTQGYVDEVTYVKPGEKIYIMIEGAGESYSIGFRCKKLESNGSYAYGFVTAAHGGVQVGNAVYSRNWDRIGHVYAKSYTQGGTVDASFVEITSENHDCANTVYQNGSSMVVGTGNLIAGSTVKKAGYATGVTSGEIIITDGHLTSSEDYIRTNDLYQATYTSSPGDSGGIVYASSNRIIAGIHKGQDTSVNTRFAVKASNIRSVMNLSQY